MLSFFRQLVRAARSPRTAAGDLAVAPRARRSITKSRRGRARLRRGCAGEQPGGQQPGAAHGRRPSRQSVTGRGSSSRCQSSLSTRKNGSRPSRPSARELQTVVSVAHVHDLPGCDAARFESLARQPERELARLARCGHGPQRQFQEAGPVGHFGNIDHAVVTLGGLRARRAAARILERIGHAAGGVRACAGGRRRKAPAWHGTTRRRHKTRRRRSGARAATSSGLLQDKGVAKGRPA